MAKKSKKRRKKHIGLKIQIVIICIVLAGLAYYYLGGYGKQVASMHQEAVEFVKNSNEDTFKSSLTSEVYDDNGNCIARLSGEKNSYYVKIEDIPIEVKSAMISTEDKKFYSHGGIDYKAIARAVIAMIKNGEVTQGGSTITQQLARNVFLDNSKTWQRKLEEIFIAKELEKKYSKDEILEFYLNNIYFANGYYGIEAASLGYFSKDVEYLTLSEIAYLCAIPNNPTTYDPVTNPKNTERRRNLILENMANDNWITHAEMIAAKEEEIELKRPKKKFNNYAETFIYYCATRRLMELDGFVFKYSFENDEEKEEYDNEYSEKYSEMSKRLYTGGYRIYTSIDLSMQKDLQNSIDDSLDSFTEKNDEGVYELQGAGVCIDNSNGMVRAIVGGRKQEYEGYTLNRAFQSFRQPGSSIKPLIVYTPSLERGYTPDTIVHDGYIEDGPENSNGTYSGDITLRTALMWSKNTIAWQLFDELTPEVGLNYLLNMEFSKIDKEDYRLPAALGGFTNGVSPLEMTSAYAAIENDGIFREPDCIRRIETSDGEELFSYDGSGKEVYKKNASRMMTSMLESVILDGTGQDMELYGIPAAGKTGTTNDNKDGWFVGFTRHYTTGVWVGYDMPRELPGLQGSTYPGSIWKDFMLKENKDLKVVDFLDYSE